jgi:hypothetical protein
MKKSGSQKSESPSQLIDARIKELGDWRGEMLSRLRTLVKEADPKGAALKDPSGLFNSSLDGNTRRAIDFHEGEKIDEEALKTLVRAAVTLNKSTA